MSAGTPNEEARKRGIEQGSRVRGGADWCVVEGFDEDGDPILRDTGVVYPRDIDEVRPPPPPTPDPERVRTAAFVALMLRIDISDHTEEQIDRAFFRASEIADRYREAAARRESRRAGSDGV